MDIPIILADAHPMLGDGLSTRLPELGPFSVTGRTSSDDALDQLLTSGDAQIVIVDMEDPDSATERIRRISAGNSARCVALSPWKGRSILHRALRAGASGYVMKTAAATDLAQALLEVAAGRRYVSPCVSHHIVDALHHGLDEDTADGAAGFGLTPREREVLEGIVAGESCRELAERLSISPRTVERHRASLMSKLDIHKTAKLVRFAVREGLVAA